MEDYLGSSSPEITYTYDSCTYGSGKLCTITQSGLTISRTYSKDGSVASESRVLDGNTYTTTYVYDYQGNPLTIVEPDGTRITYGYGASGKLNTVATYVTGIGTTTVLTNIDYAPNGKVSKKEFGNGVVSTYEYNPQQLYRLVHILTKKASTTSEGLLSGGPLSMGMRAGIAALRSVPVASLVADFQDLAAEALLDVVPPLSQVVDDASALDGGASTSDIDEQQAGLETQRGGATSTHDSGTEPATANRSEEGETVLSDVLEQIPENIYKLASTSAEGILNLLDRVPVQPLRVSKDRILGSRTYADGHVKYAYRSNVRVDDMGVSSDTLARAARMGTSVTEEVVGKRTSNSRTFATQKPGYYVTEFISGDPQYYRDSEGVWWQAEYATADRKSFSAGTKEEGVMGVVSYLDYAVRTLLSALLPGTVYAQTTGTFFPDGHPESHSVDGNVYLDNSTSWSDTRNASVSNWGSDANAQEDLRDQIGNGNGPNYYGIRRFLIVFDTSSLPDDAVIGSAEFSVFPFAYDAAGSERRFYVVSSNPASNTVIAHSDYGSVGSTAFGVSSNTYSTTTYETIALNSAGLANISTSSTSKFALRTYNDFNNVTPTNSNELAIGFYAAEQPGTSQDPKLVVVYYVPPTEPNALKAEGQSNPVLVTDPTPELSAIYNDTDATDVSLFYQINVATSSAFSTILWDSGKTAQASTSVGARIPDVSYAGPTLASSTTYYWRIRLWDNHGSVSPWSSETATFRLASTSVGVGDTSPEIQNIYYTYDPVGNITAIYDYSGTDASHVTGYTYDALNRVTSAITSAASTTPYSETYTYDKIGNITSKSGAGTYTYGASGTPNPHAPITIGGVSQTYDTAGNLINSGTSTYAWDYRSRIASAGTAGATTTYAYDYGNARVRVATASSTTLYPNPYWSKTIGTQTTTHVLANGEEVALVEVPDAGTARIGYVHGDHLSSLNDVTNDTGTVVQTTDYYPYGGVRIDTKSGTWNDVRKYIGQTYDENTKLNYLNARYQDGARGQFLSQDPVFLALPPALLADPQQQNSYSYARDNPIINKDPSGLLTVVVQGTKWDKQNSSSLGAISPKLLDSVMSSFNETPTFFNWSGKDTKAARTEAAGNLANLINNHEFSKNESLNIVGYSHGGNVAIEASNLDLNHKINNLVTIGTPVRNDYQPNYSAIDNHVNAYSSRDAVQGIFGGNLGILKYPEFGPAGRTYMGATNVDVTNLVSGLPVPSHLGLPSQSVWSKISPWLNMSTPLK